MRGRKLFNMPMAKIGNQPKRGTHPIVETLFYLKNDGENVEIVLVGDEIFNTAVHWMETPEGNRPFNCPRLNEGKKCNICKQFFEGLEYAKEHPEDQEAKKAPYRISPSTSYFFKVLMVTPNGYKPVIAKFSKSVFNTFSEKKEMGTDILDFSWKIYRKGKGISTRYLVEKEGKIDTTDEAFLEAYEIASKLDLTTMDPKYPEHDLNLDGDKLTAKELLDGEGNPWE